jgi:hypothetical protein
MNGSQDIDNSDYIESVLQESRDWFQKYNGSNNVKIENVAIGVSSNSENNNKQTRAKILNDLYSQFLKANENYDISKLYLNQPSILKAFNIFKDFIGNDLTQVNLEIDDIDNPAYINRIEKNEFLQSSRYNDLDKTFYKKIEYFFRFFKSRQGISYKQFLLDLVPLYYTSTMSGWVVIRYRQPYSNNSKLSQWSLRSITIGEARDKTPISAPSSTWEKQEEHFETYKTGFKFYPQKASPNNTTIQDVIYVQYYDETLYSLDQTTKINDKDTNGLFCRGYIDNYIRDNNNEDDLSKSRLSLYRMYQEIQNTDDIKKTIQYEISFYPICSDNIINYSNLDTCTIRHSKSFKETYFANNKPPISKLDNLLYQYAFLDFKQTIKASLLHNRNYIVSSNIDPKILTNNDSDLTNSLLENDAQNLKSIADKIKSNNTDISKNITTNDNDVINFLHNSFGEYKNIAELDLSIDTADNLSLLKSIETKILEFFGFSALETNSDTKYGNAEEANLQRLKPIEKILNVFLQSLNLASKVYATSVLYEDNKMQAPIINGSFDINIKTNTRAHLVMLNMMKVPVHETQTIEEMHMLLFNKKLDKGTLMKQQTSFTEMETEGQKFLVNTETFLNYLLEKQKLDLERQKINNINKS